ncbi:MAG: nucleoside hydrolase [Gammaproteobacteria bacterium]|nr:nucleoside hydrolase [Gammaproteobacteria bacterium]
MTRLIIDCDPGHDDAIALILAHRHAEVVGITSVSGNAPLTATTANALMGTALLDVDTPVVSGAARPLAGEPIHAAVVHGESGLGGVDRLAHQRTIAGDDAVGYLLDVAEADITVVAVGPLTNLAHVIERDPTWVKRIAGISIMGGSTDVGNATRVAEFNIFADPEAAAIVFESGAEITLCGLNLTHQFQTSDALTERLRDAGKSTATFPDQIFADLHARMETLIGRRASAMHDPCAVLAITHPHLLDTQPRAVAVELTGTLTRGMTVVDQRVSRRRDQANAKVAYEIDAERAWDVVMESLDAGRESS